MTGNRADGCDVEYSEKKIVVPKFYEYADKYGII